MVGTGVGAGNGILIKTGEALQQAKEIDTVVLDGRNHHKRQVKVKSGGYQGVFLRTTMMQIGGTGEKK